MLLDQQNTPPPPTPRRLVWLLVIIGALLLVTGMTAANLYSPTEFTDQFRLPAIEWAYVIVLGSSAMGSLCWITAVVLVIIAWRKRVAYRRQTDSD